MSEDKDSKNLPATGKKREELRSRGVVVRSQDLGATVLLAAAIVMLLVLGKYYGEAFVEVMSSSFVEIENVGPNSLGLIHNAVVMQPQLAIYQILFWMGIILLVLLAQISQVGLRISSKTLEPKITALNPINGIKNLFSVQKLVQLILGVFKMVLVVGLTYGAYVELRQSPVFTRMVGPMEYGAFLTSVIWEVGWRVLVALVVISAIDYAYQKFKYERDNRMSRQDVKEEMKQTEGNPEVKKKIRGKMLISFRRMLENMADSTIVITNPTHFAVALKYRRGETPAPMVMAKGMDRIAFKIKDKAIDLHIPIVENKPLARGLYQEAIIGEAIPVDYYRAVAIVIAGLQSEGYTLEASS
ncbi:MAG: EscU/YscU/HrcU family type III secretion system export apparatus switch protein [Verrucomicrobiota bacterium]